MNPAPNHFGRTIRKQRATEPVLVGGLPNFPGILAAMKLSTALEQHLRGLAQTLLVDDFPGATVSRSEREILATVVSAKNRCQYCTDSHAAFAGALYAKEGRGELPDIIGDALNNEVNYAEMTTVDAKLAALVRIARTVAEDPQALTIRHIEVAKDAGASDGDVQLAVLIASAFCMYNRMVDGFRARTPELPEAFYERASQIAKFGYVSPEVTQVPG